MHRIIYAFIWPCDDVYSLWRIRLVDSSALLALARWVLPALFFPRSPPLFSDLRYCPQGMFCDCYVPLASDG